MILWYVGFITTLAAIFLIPPGIIMLIVYLSGGALLPTYFYVQAAWVFVVFLVAKFSS